MVMVLLRYSVIFFGLALLINLYNKAMAFERDFMPMDPELENFNTMVDEMSVQVSEIFKILKNQNHVDDMKFANQKIIAWLLNRNKEAMSKERTEFFNMINQELKEEVISHITGSTLQPDY